MRRLINRRLGAISAIALLLSLLFIPGYKSYALSGDATVYLTRTGDCYHADGCSSLSKSKIPTTLNEAIARGKYACSRCHPGSLDAAPATKPATEPVSPAVNSTTQAAVTQTPVTTVTVPVVQTTTSGWDCIYNETYYRANNADVDKAFVGDSAGIFQHFKASGMKEGRRGSAEFDVKSYRAKNADLDAAYGDDLEKYYYHYMNTGKAEGRSGK